jgi:hypothetical protein
LRLVWIDIILAVKILAVITLADLNVPAVSATGILAAGQRGPQP